MLIFEREVSIESNASGAEGERGPVDLGFEPTGAKWRPRVRIAFNKIIFYSKIHEIIYKNTSKKNG